MGIMNQAEDHESNRENPWQMSRHDASMHLHFTGARIICIAPRRSGTR
jgi:hypothetical protein